MEKKLEGIGLSKNESKVYLALLKLGSATAGEISKHSDVHRTNVYDTVARLSEKGLISHILKDNKKHFEAARPEKLTDFLVQKRIALMEIMPELKGITKPMKAPKAHVFEGLNGIRSILWDILRTKKPVFAFGIPKNTAEIMKDFVESYHRERIKRKIHMKHIYDEDAKERIEHLNKLQYTDAIFLPREAKSPATVTMYGEKVAFYIWSDPPLGIVVESEHISNSFMRYFERLWEYATNGTGQRTIKEFV